MQPLQDLQIKQISGSVTLTWSPGFPASPGEPGGPGSPCQTTAKGLII